MNGLGFTLQKGDNLEAIIQRVVIVIAIYYALKHQRELLDISNQLQNFFYVLMALILIFFVEVKVSGITDVSLKFFKVFMAILLTTIGTYLQYILLALSDALLSTATTEATFTFTMIARPLALVILVSGLLALIRLYYYKTPM